MSRRLQNYQAQTYDFNTLLPYNSYTGSSSHYLSKATTIQDTSNQYSSQQKVIQSVIYDSDSLRRAAQICFECQYQLELRMILTTSLLWKCLHYNANQHNSTKVERYFKRKHSQTFPKFPDRLHLKVIRANQTSQALHPGKWQHLPGYQ